MLTWITWISFWRLFIITKPTDTKPPLFIVYLGLFPIKQNSAINNIFNFWTPKETKCYLFIVNKMSRKDKARIDSQGRKERYKELLDQGGTIGNLRNEVCIINV